ncbi:MAG: response regulator [Acidobacteria bacterium]|nr:response regulator [Acidobacteriota bacterium]
MRSQSAVAPAHVGAPQVEPDSEEHTSRRHVLVVDDNPDITEMLAAVLRLSGYDVSTALSAPEALKAAHERRFDVVVSDIGMPGMNGYELARALRARPDYGSARMVAVTGFAMYDDRDRALEAGFDTHLSKPVAPADLTRAVTGMVH